MNEDVSERPEAPPFAACPVCGVGDFTLSHGPGRVVGAFANSLVACDYAPLPDDLRFWVCATGHRQLTPAVEVALRAAESDYLRRSR